MKQRAPSPSLLAVRRLAHHCSFTLTLIACGQPADVPVPVDVGTVLDAELPESVTDIPWLDDGAPPIIPAAFTPCPAGWHQVPGDEHEVGEVAVVTCSPYARAGAGDPPAPDTCPDGSVHFVGDSGCTPVGVPCPEGDFPEGLPVDEVVIYVLAAAAAGGDGSRGAPFSTITDAVGRAWPGTIIAIGKGAYDGALRPRAGVTLWGACAAETRVTASTPGRFDPAVITVTTADVVLKNLRVGAAEVLGVAVLDAPASVSLDGLLIENTRGAGLFTGGGAQVLGQELVVVGTRADSAGKFGRGIVAESATVELTRVVLSHNRDTAIFAGLEGASVTLSDVLIRDTQDRQIDGTRGRGAAVEVGGALHLTRALLLRNRDTGIFAAGAGAAVTLTDVVIRDTEGRLSDGHFGRGLAVQLGATATVVRTLISNNRDVGVFVGGADTSVTVSDVIIEGTRARASDGDRGAGLTAQDGATAEVVRTMLLGNRDIGVSASTEGTSVTLSDVVIHDTRGRESDAASGRGVSVQGGAHAEVSRALISRSREAAVLASDYGSSVTLSDVLIRDSLGQENDGAFGRGLSLQLGATMEARQVVLLRNRDLAVFVNGVGTSVILSDVIVDETRPQACAETTCTAEPFGIGLGAFAGTLLANRFEVRNASLCGVMLADGGEADLTVGQVSGSQIGVCLQVDGYSVSRLTEGVQFRDNGTNLDTTSLPLPELGEPVAVNDLGT